ncbi:hypothetical protein OG373_02680 [Streptomyces avidinii]|uniref:hypothetical protein n=1 Tax=Streptomyces avidinii TaxID=1895 RepID=UPI00386A5003|nr:hypothetical protein OG373_02680 [Streptomyces avidinii]
MILPDLVLLLDAPVDALRGPRPAEHIWHVAVRNHAGDRILSDAEWGEVAAGMAAVAGIAEHGDEHACRWIAVRHATDHIHILAILASQDGRHPRLRGDILAMHAAARRFEARWGLTEMSPLDRTARRRSVTARRSRPPAAACPRRPGSPCSAPLARPPPLAHGDTDFLDRLRDAGCAYGSAAATTGPWSATRWPCPATARTAAVARCGSGFEARLRPVPAPGRERFTPHVAPAERARAEMRIREASALLGRAGQAEGAGDVAALGAPSGRVRRPVPGARP